MLNKARKIGYASMGKWYLNKDERRIKEVGNSIPSVTYVFFFLVGVGGRGKVERTQR